MQQALLYQKYISWNPSFKHYVVMMGYETHLRTDQELIDFWVRVMDKRSMLASWTKAIAIVHEESIIPQ